MNYSENFDGLDPDCVNIGQNNLKNQFLNALIVKASLYVAEDNGGNIMTTENISHIVASCRTVDATGAVVKDDSGTGIHAFATYWKDSDPVMQRTGKARLDIPTLLGVYSPRNVQTGTKAPKIFNSSGAALFLRGFSFCLWPGNQFRS